MHTTDLRPMDLSGPGIDVKLKEKKERRLNLNFLNLLCVWPFKLEILLEFFSGFLV